MIRRTLLFAALVIAMTGHAMALTPVIESNQTNTLTDDTMRVAKPTSLAAGDMVLLIAISANNTAGPCYTATDGAFTTIQESGNATCQTAAWAAYKIATASEPDSYFVASACGSDAFVIWAVRVSGLDTWAPLNTVGSATNTAINQQTITLNGIATTRDSCLVFAIGSFDGGDGDPFSISGTGWSEYTQGVSGTSVSTDVGGLIGTATVDDTATTAAAVIDATGTTSDGWSGFQFAIHGHSTTDPPAASDSIYFQGTSAAGDSLCEDALLYSGGGGDDNFGGDTYGGAGLRANSTDGHIVVRFPNLDAIATDWGITSSDVDSMRIYLYCREAPSDSVYAEFCTQSWVEGTGTGNATDSIGVSWTYRDSTDHGSNYTAWSTAGGSHSSTTSSKTMVDATGAYFAFLIEQTAAQLWIDVPSTNWGVVMWGLSATDAAFETSEGTDGQRPRITIYLSGGGAGGTPNGRRRRALLRGGQ